MAAAGAQERYSAGNVAGMSNQYPTGSSLLTVERTRALMGPVAIRHVGCAPLSGETVEKTPNWRKKRRDLDLRLHPIRKVSHVKVFPGWVFFLWRGIRSKGGRNARGRRGDVEVDQKEQLNSTTFASRQSETQGRGQNSIKLTFRVDSCSKHLLAAPLIVQNVDAWKSNRNCK